MRAAEWLVKTVAASRSRPKRTIAAVVLLFLIRAQTQSPIAKRIAKESARKKLVVATSFSVSSEPLIRRALDKQSRTSSPAIKASADILIPRRQNSSTAALALAGRTT